MNTLRKYFLALSVVLMFDFQNSWAMEDSIENNLINKKLTKEEFHNSGSLSDKINYLFNRICEFTDKSLAKEEFEKLDGLVCKMNYIYDMVEIFKDKEEFERIDSVIRKLNYLYDRVEVTLRISLLEKENEILKNHSNCLIQKNLSVPDPEQIYQKFLKGVLIYRPTLGRETGRVELPIAELLKPLEGAAFDLSRCGNASNYLSISTGYRKSKKMETANKWEIWLAPRFLVEKELNTTASHFQSIFPQWKPSSPVGIFWTYGGWDNLGRYDYLTSRSMDNIGTENLYTKWAAAIPSESPSYYEWHTAECMMHFHICF